MFAKNLSRFGIPLALLFPFTLATAAEPNTPTPFTSSSAIEKARGLLEKEIVSKVPGLSVAVAVNGSPVWRENFGYADLANKVRVTSKTRFRIGSVSKSLASVGLALLVERGQLDLDVPIQNYIPDFPKKSAPITVRLLAGHLSGIRNYRDGEALSNLAYPDARSRLKIFEADPLIASPGEKFNYSGYNWNVIEVAMERAARQNFATYMKANLLGPLRLNDTRTDEPGTADAERTQFYEVDEKGAFIFGPPLNLRHAWATGGYLSTADDLVRFGSALLRPGFLKESSLQTLFTPQTTNDGKTTEYGVGWNTYPEPKVTFHSGWTVGGLSILLMLPDSNVVVAILTNRGGLNIPEGHRLHFNIEEIGFKLARLFGS
jgi:serine beta-lactamase-like protein LACTB, mitochondrial